MPSTKYWLNSFFTVLLCLLISACNSNVKPKVDKNKSQPNIVLFLVDDMGWTDSGTYGSDLYQTPHIDQLAADGMQFSDAYAACTVCSPTRSSLMTGKYPATNNLTDWITGHKKPYAKLKIPDWNMKLDHKETTLAEAFKAIGYNTVHMGKWHLGEEEKYWPEHQGFDLNLGGYNQGSPNKRNDANGYFSPYGNPRLTDGPKGEYLTERLAKEAVAYINNQKDKPFFLNLWLYNVHTPLQAKKDKIEKYKGLLKDSLNHQNPVYAAMVEHMDDALGTVVAALEANGLSENTILVFTSDNGGLIGNKKQKKRQVTSNAPLRSGKGDMYEGGVRVPFIVKWPEQIKAGTLNKLPVISPDVFPTLLSLAQHGSIGDYTENIDGVDISPSLLAKGEVQREAIYWHYPHYHSQGATPYSAIRKGDWKLIEIFEEDRLELYNLKTDIGEKENLAELNISKREELYKDLKAWRTQVNAQLPSENPEYDKSRAGESYSRWNKKKK